MSTDTNLRLARLGDALHDATAADLAPRARRRRRIGTERRRRLGGRTAIALAVAAVAIPGAALAANALISPSEVAESLPAGTLMLQGTEPSCSVVRDQVEYRCTLAKAPQEEIAPGDFKGTVEPTVDAKGIVDGGCRALDADGLEWECYIGQEAVRQKIVGPEYLGAHVEGPGVG